MKYVVQFFTEDEWITFSEHTNKEYALINAEIVSSRGDAQVMYGKECVFKVLKKEIKDESLL